MPLLPKGSLLTFSTSAVTSVVAIDGDVNKQARTINFSRKEFSNALLLNLPESDGTEPILIKNIVGLPIQFSFNCGSASSIRDPLPDDANIDNILKAMKIRTWTAKGAPCSPSEVEKLYTLSVDHAERIKSFEGYQNLFSERLSWQFFKALQSSSFAYMTATGLSVTGIALATSGASVTESNILIRSFRKGQTHEDVKRGLLIASDWEISFDVITFENQRTYTG